MGVLLSCRGTTHMQFLLHNEEGTHWILWNCNYIPFLSTVLFSITQEIKFYFELLKIYFKSHWFSLMASYSTVLGL